MKTQTQKYSDKELCEKLGAIEVMHLNKDFFIEYHILWEHKGRKWRSVHQVSKQLINCDFDWVQQLKKEKKDRLKKLLKNASEKTSCLDY